MDRREIIQKLKEFFDLQELVGKWEYQAHGELCWRYLRTELLHTLLIVRRDILKAPMYANNWVWDGNYDERGLRVNISTEVKVKTSRGALYVSAHCLGAALDFTVKGMSAENARQKIIQNAHLLPYPIRLEKGVSWVHLDVYDDINSDQKVTLFKA